MSGNIPSARGKAGRLARAEAREEARGEARPKRRILIRSEKGRHVLECRHQLPLRLTAYGQPIGQRMARCEWCRDGAPPFYSLAEVADMAREGRVIDRGPPPGWEALARMRAAVAEMWEASSVGALDVEELEELAGRLEAMAHQSKGDGR